ncbi:RNA polymerase sigma factor RpoD/SigA [Candidatus Haliotispira prima]|uniref:RNA polymerase sigma factor n=1 Tax=Candidatus Haliotispira prima TaxID=3034016 RepID=A0ABY8MIB7_9SPIO|nr:RNA polymerase sigma factor RpoD/SigA [Candidatus Haliotispira prima]
MDEKDALGIYLKGIKNIPLISREEENRLALAAREGNIEARNKLVQSHLRFVISVAKKYQNNGMALEDLISEGNIGLIHALEHYDVGRGLHFISYAVWWVRQSILKALNEQARSIRLPTNRSNQLRQIEKRSKEIRDASGTTPEFEEVVELLEYTLSDMREIRNIAQEMISLNQKQSDDGSPSLEDQVATDAYSPEEQALLSCMSDDVFGALKILRDKEADILVRRFGLDGRESMSLRQIALVYKLTKERVRQIEKQALQTLQNSPKTRHLEEYCAS